MAQFIVKETENKYEAIKELQNTHLDATITVGTENTNAINVAVQLKSDKAQAAIATRRVLDVYISGVNTGADIVGTAPNGGVAIGTNGKILASVVADKYFKVVCNTSGQFDLTLTDSGTPTFYLVVVMPNGRLVISSAITFA